MEQDRLEDITAILAFLFFLEQDKGSNYMYGGRLLKDVIESTVRIAGFDTDLIPVLREKICQPI